MSKVTSEQRKARKLRTKKRAKWCSCGPCSTGCKPSEGNYCGQRCLCECVNPQTDSSLVK